MLEFIATYKTPFLILTGFLIIAVSSNEIAKLFQRINLPLISGLLFTGIIAGPYVIGLIPANANTELKYINETALAFIAFAAGAELYIRELRSRFNSIKWNTFGQLFVTFIAGTLALYFISDYIPFMNGQRPQAQLAIAAITAAVFVARSPASAIAVINELRAKGPFTQTVMGVTVVKDFLVIVLFSICLSVGQSVITGIKFNFLSFGILLLELAVSFGVGFYVFGNLLKFPLSLKVRGSLKTILVVLIGYSAYALSNYIREVSPELLHHEIFLEPLLMCILASFHVTNYSRYRMEFIKIIHDAGIPIYVAFFTLTGASLDISVLVDVLDVALILFLVRIITMIMGSYVGGYLAKDPPLHVRLGWMPYITQAGVALGLTTVISSEFPEWGNQFATLIIAVIVINQFIGPPLFKWAIFKIGEDRIRGESGYDNILDAIIVGYEPTSVALARTLMEKGWEVQIATKSKKGSIEEPDDIDLRYISEFSKAEFDAMNAEKTEVIVLLMSDEENLKVAEMAYHEYGTRDIVVRINQRYFQNKFLALNCRVIDPSTAMVSLLDHFVRSPQATSLLLGMQKDQDTRDIEVFNPDMHGIALRDLRLPTDVIILSIKRSGQTIISHGYTRLRIRDIVTVVGSIKSLDEVQFKFDQ